jgi:hypothetical protein
MYLVCNDRQDKLRQMRQDLKMCTYRRESQRAGPNTLFRIRNDTRENVFAPGVARCRQNQAENVVYRRHEECCCLSGSPECFWAAKRVL